MPTKKRRVLRVRAPPPPPHHHRRPLPSLVVALVVVVVVAVVMMSDPAGCEIANDPADNAMMHRDGDVAFVVGVVVDPAATKGASEYEYKYDNDDDDDDGEMMTATTSHDRSAAAAPTTSRGLEFLRGGGAGTTGRRDGGRGGRSGGIFRRAFSRAVGGGLPGAIAGIVQVLSMMWVVSCFIFRRVSCSFVRSFVLRSFFFLPSFLVVAPMMTSDLGSCTMVLFRTFVCQYQINTPAEQKQNSAQ
jgi:hypothetical protein